ncbi:MAG: Re/Si-specific NAD(P)(+) transhydrogenase subunit alpha, partial [Bacteroidia bacterium]|nr:Re/Si-specific NAD(P)(+) transhydrogenase subunit alpha [Bacteroidia bacterium]
MIIGIIKESGEETRVSLLPEDADKLIKVENQVLVEQGAGDRSHFSDDNYKDAGAEIASKADVMKKADVIIKVSAPTEEEIGLLESGKLFIGVFQPLTNESLCQQLASKNVISFSLDSIPRISRAQALDILSSMSSLAGYKAVLLGATHLPRFFPMVTSAAVTIRPAQVLIMGVGVAGLQAIATAKRLGAQVYAFDTRPETKEQVESLGGKFIEVGGEADASAAGGYAVEQSDDYKKRQGELIHQNAVKSDVIITTALIPGRKAPILITKEAVKEMKPGSVIIDLAAITGGNCELTKNDEVIVEHGVTIVGDSALASSMPDDASRMFGKNVMNFLKLFVKDGKNEMDFEDEIIKGS